MVCVWKIEMKKTKNIGVISYSIYIMDDTLWIMDVNRLIPEGCRVSHFWYFRGKGKLFNEPL